MDTGTWQITSCPSRLKKSWGSTWTITYRSPGGPPPMPASPSPESRSRLPVSTPAGILTETRRTVFTWPAPRQWVQGWLTIWPAPRQRGQVVRRVKNPWLRVTWPEPWHWLQTSGSVPGSQVVPPQTGHTSRFSTSRDFSTPKAASMKERRRS